jgi:hypothetical protein
MEELEHHTFRRETLKKVKEMGRDKCFLYCKERRKERQEH